MSVVRRWGFATALLAVCATLGVHGRQEGPEGQELIQIDPSAGKQAGHARTYIVRMADEPVAAYTGTNPGYRATKPAKGQRLNPHDPAVISYASFLGSTHDAVVGRVGGRKIYDYLYAFNGFSAVMTPEQAALLAEQPGVVSIEEDAAAPLATITTPQFLGLPAAGGLWDQLGGADRAGEDMILGMVDGGVWPEHPSFSDRTGTNSTGKEAKLSYQQIPHWNGKCTPGEAFNASMCNQKLIGAQYFAAGRLANLPLPDYEYLSPRDFGGHGTHTSTTAGGNAGVPIPGTAAIIGGIAPRARIASYKVCFDDGAGNGICFTSDSVAAIDQAVIDGVDAINFSIGGSSTSFVSSVSLAFFNAAEAGVFVAAAAGNSGPTASTVVHGGPWVTTVAATTHPRTATTTLTLGNGDIINGVSLGSGTPQLPIVLSTAAGLPGKDDPATPDNEIALCFPGTLDPAKVAGKMVLCERGINARVEKSFVVQQAGGLAMILANPSAPPPPAVQPTLDADLHSVPTIHVTFADGTTIKTYVAGAGAGATGRLANATIAIPTPTPAPTIAGFSSRGPLAAGGGDLLKPDVAAPGVNVMAGVAPPGNSNALFAAYQGTSMATPHVAGLAVLLKQLHPDWTPMMIKSALMTSAAVMPGGTTTPFLQGAGFVNPKAAADPGLVYNSSARDWLAFLCGTGQVATSACTAAGVTPIDPRQLNVPSIAIGALFDNVPYTVTRTVTNVGGAAATYTGSLSFTAAGFTASFSPATLALEPNESKSYTVTFTRTGVPAGSALFNVYAFGSMTWSDGAHTVRIPIADRPIQILTSTIVNGSGATGSLTFNSLMGYGNPPADPLGPGPYSLRPHGLVADTRTVCENECSIKDDADNSFPTTMPVVTEDVFVQTIVAPPGTRVLRFALFNEFTNGAHDLDLYVFQVVDPPGPPPPFEVLVGSSTGATTNETITLTQSGGLGFGGTLKVYVHAFETEVDADGKHKEATFSLFHWLVGAASAGNMKVSLADDSVTPGQNVAVTASWGDEAALPALEVGRKFLGSITHHRCAAAPSTLLPACTAPASYTEAQMAVTIVFIDVPAPPPTP